MLQVSNIKLFIKYLYFGKINLSVSYISYKLLNLVLVGNMGERKRSFGWNPPLNLYISRETARIFTPLKSWCHECVGNFTLFLVSLIDSNCQISSWSQINTFDLLIRQKCQLFVLCIEKSLRVDYKCSHYLKCGLWHACQQSWDCAACIVHFVGFKGRKRSCVCSVTLAALWWIKRWSFRKSAHGYVCGASNF